MRILFATRGFPPDATGGTEVYTYMLAAALQRAGHEVSVICIGRWTDGPNHFNGCTVESFQGVTTTKLHFNWMRAPDPNRYLYDNSVVERFVSQHLTELKPDVVHVTSCDRLSASVILTVKRAGIPVVLSLMDFWFLCPKINLARWDGQLCDGDTSPWECLKCSLAPSLAYRWTDAILPERSLQAAMTTLSKKPSLARVRGLRGLALNMFERKSYLASVLNMVDCATIATPFGASLFRDALPQNLLRLTPYGHDLSWLSGHTHKTWSQELRFGFIGSLCEAKGPHLLIEAFRRIPRTSAVRLFIYGEFPKDRYGEKLLELASTDQRIHFCGRYAHERSAEVYPSLDVLVIPSLWYDFPLVAHEALASRTVVVATNLMGLNEIIQDEVNGLLFERDNVDALAAQLRRLTDSPELLARLRDADRKVRSIEDVVTEFEEIYSRLREGLPCQCSKQIARETPDLDERMRMNHESYPCPTTPSSAPAHDVSIIMVSWNDKEYLKPCLDSIYGAGLRHSVEVVVVDNGSADGSQAMLREQFPGVRLIQNEANLGLSRASNQGIAASRGRYLLLLNNDTVVDGRSLDKMVDFLDTHPDAAVVGGRLLNPDRSLQAGYNRFSTLKEEFLVATRLGRLVSEIYPSQVEERQATVVDWLGSACLLLRREALHQVGLLDEDYFIYGDEVDLQYRFRNAGWSVYFLPSAHTVHFGGRSMDRWRRRRMVYRGKMLFYRKNYGLARTAMLRLMLGSLSLVKMLPWCTALAIPSWRRRATMELRSNLDVLRLCLTLT
ncbi:MAG: glycosyltransferase [Acidobacteriales bacterium]|nr:glycosyltransferase [Terriglobales bacterium]